jgi:hypothetical protein
MNPAGLLFKSDAGREQGQVVYGARVSPEMARLSAAASHAVYLGTVSPEKR